LGVRLVGEARESILVILGAGASYDFVAGAAGLRNHPPLTNGLVGVPPASNPTERVFLDETRVQVLNQIPDNAASPLVGYLRDQLTAPGAKESLEQVLERVVGTGDGLTRELIALRMYLREYFELVSMESIRTVGGDSNQARLVRALAQQAAGRRLLYVTFNYDTLLDSALRSQYSWPKGPPAMEHYLGDPRWSLCKLHGSWDWTVETNVAFDPLGLIVDAQRTLMEQGELGRVDVRRSPIDVFPHDAERVRMWLAKRGDATSMTVRLPMLAIPATGSVKFACPDEMRDDLERALPSVSKVLVIGWKGQEEHFLQLLSGVPGDSVRKGIPPGVGIFVVNPSRESRENVAATVGQRVSNIRVFRVGESPDSAGTFSWLVRDPSALATFLA
jgi:hypothetical protein